MIGTILDSRYRVEEWIGDAHDGGKVYRGRDTNSGASVVIRCPAWPADITDEERAKFLDECERLAKVAQRSNEVESLLSSGILTDDDGTETGFTVFEWLSGRSLERFMKERSAASSVGETLKILEPAARALGVAHALGLAHGDVRPANLWLAERDGRTRLKVAAFAIASRIRGARAFAPAYGAPEHFNKSYGAIGPATDVYGLALVIIEMVTGKPALSGADAGELYLAASDLAKRPSVRARGGHASMLVEGVLARALAVDPRRRHANVKELWSALLTAVPELTPAPGSVRGSMEVTPESVPSMPTETASVREAAARTIHARTPTPQWVWMVLAAAGVFAVGVLIARLSASPPPPRASTVPPPPPAVEAGPTAKAESAVSVRPFLTDMVHVPAAAFVMGGKEEGKPQHRVELTRAFYIDRTEVRADAYSACVEDGACSPNRIHEGDLALGGFGCFTVHDHPDFPANCVDRAQAEKFCAFASKRLPTEAEWELAARGTDGRDYPWGSAPPATCATANVAGVTGPCAEHRGASEVGAAAEGKSPYGALDMAGNVWEWVADGYEPYAANPDAGVLTDPKVSLSPSGRGVLRGGSWDYAITSARVSFRLPLAPSTGNNSTGFRCARDD